MPAHTAAERRGCLDALRAEAVAHSDDSRHDGARDPPAAPVTIVGSIKAGLPVFWGVVTRAG